MTLPLPGGLRPTTGPVRPFVLDPFQAEAIAALERGASVLVSAPTGSGKTVVAEHAVARALARGAKAFYTTPLKALSNQKFGELRERHGSRRVGLLTGDIAVNADAPVVVMTTEVLRNMLFASSPQLHGLGVVILDEVHYLQDPYRGSVWEEVIVLAPPHVALVCLSATVSNAEELGAWLRSVRGATDVVVESRRPVSLHHHLAVAERGTRRVELVPVLRDGSLHPAAARLDSRVARLARRPGGLRHSQLATPRRTELLEALADHELLPAIVFIFSRAACDDAVRQCLADGVRLTDASQRAEIRHRCERHTEGLPDDELRVLGYAQWAAGLEAGVASHHAGLIPAFREAVESCFADGLLGVVYATETLSLGINMPARTVVVERLTKVRDSGRSALTSGEYAQLTGRAGRRGLDQCGHGVVLWSPQVQAADVGRLATMAPPALRSSFRPTYNLAANLVRRYPQEQARTIVDRSFAQFLGGRHPRALSERLDRMLTLLRRWGYVESDAWCLTGRGRMLVRIYHESDLFVAEALASGLFDGLDPAELAGVVSACTFEVRSPRTRDVTVPTGPMTDRLRALHALVDRLRDDEVRSSLAVTRMLDSSFADTAWRWARGQHLPRVLERAELAPGDFVRTTRQLVDLLRQLAGVADDPATAASAAKAAQAIDRGVVASTPGPWGLDETEAAVAGIPASPPPEP